MIDLLIVPLIISLIRIHVGLITNIPYFVVVVVVVVVAMCMLILLLEELSESRIYLRIAGFIISIHVVAVYIKTIRSP